jgi:hypothetical protein
MPILQYRGTNGFWQMYTAMPDNIDINGLTAAANIIVIPGTDL